MSTNRKINGDSRLFMRMYRDILDNNTESLKNLLGKEKRHLNDVLLFWPAPLAIACQLGHLQCAEILVNAGADISYRTEGNSTLLHLACEGGCSELVGWLLDRGLNVNALNWKRQIPLYYAVLRNRYAVIRLLISRGSLVNSWSSNYKLSNNRMVHVTLLGVASANNNARITRMLLEAGAKVHPKKFPGNFTPLHMACYYGAQKTTRLLIAAKAHVNSAERQQWETPLHVAVRHEHVRIVRILLNECTNKISIDQVDRSGRTALHAACELNNIEILRLLLEKGASLMVRDKCQYTPLHLAIMNMKLEGIQLVANKLEQSVDLCKVEEKRRLLVAMLNSQPEIAEYMVKMVGDNINNVDANRLTILHHAVRRGKAHLVKILLNHGADYKIADNDGLTAFHYAAKTNQATIVRAMMETNVVPIDYVDAGQMTALHLAVINKCKESASVLLQFGADPNRREIKMRQAPLHIALRNLNGELIDLLLEHGADVRLCMDEGVTPLHLAVFQGGVSNVVKLLTRGAYLDAKLTSKKMGSLTPIEFWNNKTSDFKVSNYVNMMIKFFKSIDLNDCLNVRYYLEQGACIDCRSIQYKTGLIHASRKGSVHMVKLLLDNKANVRLKDDGDGPDETATALHYAVRYGHYSIVCLLLSYGACYSDVDRSGKTALQLAEQMDTGSTVKIVDHRQSNKCKQIVRLLNVITELFSHTRKPIDEFIAAYETYRSNCDANEFAIVTAATDQTGKSLRNYYEDATEYFEAE